MKRSFCIAIVLLAGPSILWGQRRQQVEPVDWSDPAAATRVLRAGRMLSAGTATAKEPFAAVPDAPSASSDAAPGESSSRPAPASQPDSGGGEPAVVRPAEKPSDSQKFHWGPALRQSLILLTIEHGFRMTQTYTRKRLKGPFFQDWFDSVAGMSGWSDGDVVVGNYVGHPMQGAVSGYIQIQNDPRGMRQEFGNSPEYWKSRMKAFGWAAAYSTQYELGPLSDASIGNSGQKKGTKSAVDLVVTPVAGLGWMITEDALDKYVIRGFEEKHQSRNWRAAARSLLNPSRSFANLLRKKAPWHRDTRDGVNAVARREAPPASAPRPAAATPPAPTPAPDPSASAAQRSCTQPCR